MLENAEFLVIATVGCNMNSKNSDGLLWGIAIESMLYAGPIGCCDVVQGSVWQVKQGRISKAIIESHRNGVQLHLLRLSALPLAKMSPCQRSMLNWALGIRVDRR